MLNGIYYGNVNSSFDTSNMDLLFAQNLNVFMRQIVTSTFMLNGILVGIVTGIYDREEESKELIFMLEKIEGIREFEIAYSKIRRWTNWLQG